MRPLRSALHSTLDLGVLASRFPGRRHRSGDPLVCAYRLSYAEVSDWLTKLLLGAGLVQLTRLGRPLVQLGPREVHGQIKFSGRDRSNIALAPPDTHIVTSHFVALQPDSNDQQP